jgi:hypothetical protein
MFEIITRLAPEARRSVPLHPDTPATVAQGQILSVGAGGHAALADGAAVVPAPLWAFTKSGRLDVDIGKSVTVVEAPFVAKIGTDGYAGTPALGNALAVGTGADAGKLVVQAITADNCATLQAVVAYCTKAPDANGVIEFKAIR